MQEPRTKCGRPCAAPPVANQLAKNHDDQERGLGVIQLVQREESAARLREGVPVPAGPLTPALQFRCGRPCGRLLGALIPLRRTKRQNPGRDRFRSMPATRRVTHVGSFDMLEGQAELDGESEENRDGQRKQIWSGKTKMVRENEDNQGEQRLSRKTKIAWKTKMVRENKDGQGKE